MQGSGPASGLLMGLGALTSIVGVVLVILLMSAMTVQGGNGGIEMPDLLSTPTPRPQLTPTPAAAGTPTAAPQPTRTLTPTRTPTPAPVATHTPDNAPTAAAGQPTFTPTPALEPGAPTPTPAPTFTPTPMPVTALASCGAKPFPLYPGTAHVESESAEVEALLRQKQSFLATQTEWSINPNAIATFLGARVFSVDATSAQVLDFYEAGMADADWVMTVMQPDFGYIEGSCNRGAKRIAIATFVPFETSPITLGHGGYIVVVYQ